jgi:hypothetical protein
MEHEYQPPAPADLPLALHDRIDFMKQSRRHNHPGLKKFSRRFQTYWRFSQYIPAYSNDLEFDTLHFGGTAKVVLDKPQSGIPDTRQISPADQPDHRAGNDQGEEI